VKRRDEWSEVTENERDERSDYNGDLNTVGRVHSLSLVVRDLPAQIPILSFS
jgi:hypothetical protein